MEQGEWRPVDSSWDLKAASVVCRDLDCGSAVSIRRRYESSRRSVWWINTDCVQSGSTLKECSLSLSSSSTVEITCSGESISDIISDSQVQCLPSFVVETEMFSNLFL